MSKKTKIKIEFELTDKRKQLVNFVHDCHAYFSEKGIGNPQLRKWTGEDYYVHPVATANKAAEAGYDNLLVEAMLCHDLVEDTLVTYKILVDKLTYIGYNEVQVETIVELVRELTDVYSKEDYPFWNRARRRAAERIRLKNISKRGQTGKYLDNLDNSETIFERDVKFAKTYVAEMEENLKEMNQGDPILLEMLIDRIKHFKNEHYENEEV